MEARSNHSPTDNDRVLVHLYISWFFLLNHYLNNRGRLLLYPNIFSIGTTDIHAKMRNKRPNKLRYYLNCVIKWTKLSTAHIWTWKALTYYKHENQPSVRRHISNPSQFLSLIKKIAQKIKILFHMFLGDWDCYQACILWKSYRTLRRYWISNDETPITLFCYQIKIIMLILN